MIYEEWGKKKFECESLIQRVNGMERLRSLVCVVEKNVNKESI
jgi:hypothetical protein